MVEKEYEITHMMYETGNYVVQTSTGRWWANENHKGCLIEAVSSDDMAIIHKLVRERRGGVRHETKRFYI